MSTQPLYQQVADQMRTNIRIGMWQEGNKIPAEYDLCDIYHVSRITVRRALDQLVREKLLIRHRAIGTFVSKEQLVDKPEQQYTLVKSFTNEMKELGIRIETISASIRTTHASPSVANYLHIKPGEEVIELKRLRGESGNSIGFFVTYFKMEPFFSLRKERYLGSLYEYLAELGFTISNDREVVEGMLPTKELCDVFKIGKYVPILRRSRFTSDVTHNFYEYTECYYIGSKYKYFIDFRH